MKESYGHSFLETLWQVIGKSQKGSSREFAAQVFAAVVPTAALYSQYVVQVIDFYLDDDQRVAREEILRLATSTDENASKRIMAYVYEALRLRPPVTGVFRTATKADILDLVEVESGNLIFASIAAANLNVSSSGPDAANIITDFGAKGLLTSDFFELTVPAVLFAILRLKDLERGAGNSGRLIRFEEEMYGTKAIKYINFEGLISPWADSLVVRYTK